MRNIHTIAAIAFFFMVSITAASAQVSEIRKIASFDKVDISGAFDVYLKKGDKSALTIETEDIAPEDIVTEIRGNTLHISLKDKKFNVKDLERSVIYLTYTQLKRIEWSGAGNIHTETPLKGDDFELDISGAGNIKMDLEVQSLVVNMSGAGNVELRGNAKSQQVDMSGAGNYNCFDLKSETAKVSMSGVGNVRVYVTEEIQADASGVGNVRYKGNPKHVRKSSSNFLGSVKPAD